MTENNPQQTPTGQVPGFDNTLPQQRPAAAGSLDSDRMPPGPLGAQRERDRDYEASFKGLNTWVTTEFNSLRNQVSALSGIPEQLTQLASRLEALGQPQAPPAKEPQGAREPAGRESQQEDNDNPLYVRLKEMEAERYRDGLLYELTQPGKPGEGLPLMTFRDNIPAIAPDTDDDGVLDDSAQRKAIDDFIARLKGVKGDAAQQTQRAMTAGVTPGVAPGPVPGQTQEEQLARYYELKELIGSAAMQELGAEEQGKIRSDYYALHDLVGRDLPNQTMPWMENRDIAEWMKSIQSRVGNLEGFMMPK